MARLMTALLMFAALTGPGVADALPDDWPFPHEHRSDLVFIHHLVNYAAHPDRQREWERDLARGNALRCNVGSVKTKDFRTLLEMNLNTPLGGGWRFLYRLDWYRGLDRDLERQQHWLGLETGIVGPVALQISTHPAPDKESMDLQAGILIHSADRRRFLRLGLRFDDFQYTEKNDLNGEQTRSASGLVWEARQAGPGWEIFTAGVYFTPAERRFDDATASPELAGTMRHRGRGEVRLRRLSGGEWRGEVGAEHYRFRARDERRAAPAGFD